MFKRFACLALAILMLGSMIVGCGGDGALVQRFAAGVLRVGHKAQLQAGDIFLAAAFGKADGAGGLSHKHGQHTGGHGVESAGVADLLGFQNAAQLGADIHGSPALGLVDDDNTVCHFMHLPLLPRRAGQPALPRPWCR